MSIDKFEILQKQITLTNERIDLIINMLEALKNALIGLEKEK